jgi:regulator of nucleoside diphosphate kinase
METDMSAALPAITVAEEDYNRLSALLDKVEEFTETIDQLDEELSRAEMVPLADMPDDVVTMNSTIRFLNEDTGQENELELVYPHEFNPNERHVSILAPAGAAMLGLSIGKSIEWQVKGRAPLHLKIVRVTRKTPA